MLSDQNTVIFSTHQNKFSPIAYSTRNTYDHYSCGMCLIFHSQGENSSPYRVSDGSAFSGYSENYTKHNEILVPMIFR